MHHTMSSDEVIKVYQSLEDSGIVIWIDGGWCVDALLGKQLRPHKDLDIAINWKDVPEFRKVLKENGYAEKERSSKWNFVLADNDGNEIDVHAFVTDHKGKIVDGIMYPEESLTGMGAINNEHVKCISPEYMVKFLSPFISKWPEKYVPAVFQLCQQYKILLPREYKNHIEQQQLSK